jgi:hypothetical protein
MLRFQTCHPPSSTKPELPSHPPGHSSCQTHQ